MNRRSWDRDTLPTGAEKVTAVREMFDAIAPRYDLVNRIMTFRLDVRWRRRAVRTLGLPGGSTVIDLAAGTGDLCIDLQRAGHHPIAFDLSFGMLANDRSASPRVQADILRLPLPDASVDGATCGFALRNLRELPAFFAELARVVRPGGRIALLDVGVLRPVLVDGKSLGASGVLRGNRVPAIADTSTQHATTRRTVRNIMPRLDSWNSSAHPHKRIIAKAPPTPSPSPYSTSCSKKRCPSRTPHPPRTHAQGAPHCG